MFSQTDAAEQAGVEFRPSVLPLFRADARALHVRAFAGEGRLPMELKSVGCKTDVCLCIEAGGDDVMAHVLAGFLISGSSVLAACSPISFKPSTRLVER
jgi:hypothetical protein